MLIVFLVNIYIVRELLTAEFINQMGSIESTQLSLARYALENWRDLTWFPLWYGGIPYQNAYPPLLSLTVAAVAGVTGMTFAHAFHFMTAIFYALGPVLLFALALKMSGSPGASFAASIFYSLISPSTFLIAAVRRDGGVWHPRRFQAMVQYGEGPHVTSLTLLALGLLLLIIAFEKRRPLWWLLAAITCASVVLTNWLGGFTMAVAVAMWLLVMPQGTWRKNWLKAAALGLYAYAIACRWLPPSTIATIFGGEKYMSGALAPGSVRVAFVLIGGIAVALLLAVFRRYKAPVHLQFSVLFLIPMAVLTLAAEWFGIFLMPQPQRYHLQMEMGIALVLAFAVKPIFDRMSVRLRLLVACGLVLFCVYPAKRDRRYARWLDRHIDIHSTIEYREADWFRKHMDGHRVFAHGSVGFFLNVFTDTPQYGGGFDQGNINP
ncbi:MAG: hypothetical protein JWO48_733, partial [Bryobacterales bacterium]|nr:hypothetical protein [Bryobacterales bacterium]